MVNTTDEKNSEFISYGFRTKERLPFSNGTIRTIILNGGAKIFRLLAEGNMKEVKIILDNNPELNQSIGDWVDWDEEKEAKNNG